MEIIIREDAAQVASLVVQLVKTRLLQKPELVLGCATGRTMEAIYSALIAEHQRGLSFSNCSTFNLDEYIGLPKEDKRSYHFYMREKLFNHIDILPGNTHLPNGMADNLDEEAKRYERDIYSSGGIALQLLGLGETGHIGFNEPLSSLQSRTREKALTPTTRQQNAEMFGGDPDAVPARALTMGVGTILEADEIIMVVTGETKADILAKATEGPITAMISATALQLHRDCKVIVDEAAASQLQGQDYYRWVFEHEPEWQRYH